MIISLDKRAMWRFQGKGRARRAGVIQSISLRYLFSPRGTPGKKVQKRSTSMPIQTTNIISRCVGSRRSFVSYTKRWWSRTHLKTYPAMVK